MSKLKSVSDRIFKNWKSSLSGLLSAVIGFSAVASTPNPWIPSNVGIKILGAAAIAKVLLGLMATDGKQINVALPPGTELHQDTTVTTPETK